MAKKGLGALGCRFLHCQVNLLRFRPLPSGLGPLPSNVRWTWSDSVGWTWSGHPGSEGVLWQGRWTWCTLSKWTWSGQSQEELVSWQGTAFEER